jgi:RNA polymerase sigma-54 factor
MAFDARLSSKPSLEGHLDWQMRLSNFTERELSIGEAICGSLDSSGYLSATAEELAGMTGTTPEEVEGVLHRVQRFDPVGVAARSPRSACWSRRGSLDIRIRLGGAVSELWRTWRRKLKPLGQMFRISMEQLKGYLDIIPSLDPLPGASFGSSEPIFSPPTISTNLRLISSSAQRRGLPSYSSILCIWRGSSREATRSGIIFRTRSARRNGL